MCHTQALTVRAPLILSSPLGGGLPENFHSLLYLQSQHNAWNTSRFYEKTFFTTKSWHSKHRKLQPYRYHQNLAGWDSTVICKHWSPNTWTGDEIQKELYTVSNKQVYPVTDWVSATCQTSAIPWEERDTASPVSQGGIHTLVIQTGYMPYSMAENERKAHSKKHASIPIFRKGNTTNFATEPNFNSR